MAIRYHVAIVFFYAAGEAVVSIAIADKIKKISAVGV
jgi:hypothetical protein